MSNEHEKLPAPTFTPDLAPQPTEEQLKKQVRRLDFDLGANTKHLRLPNGLPRQK